jgi:hypothetical protein
LVGVILAALARRTQRKTQRLGCRGTETLVASLKRLFENLNFESISRSLILAQIFST